MFDFSFGELALLGIIALLVVGPEKMPELARTAGRWYGAMRRTMTGLRSEVEQQLLLDDLRQEANKLRDYAKEELLPADIIASDTLKTGGEKPEVKEEHRQGELDIMSATVPHADLPGPEDRVH
ncbi:Sec-independent protein translocase protein TatB [Acidithiobacillus sp.]|jgi:sec-independent protein translocase protein TatB|uniref:Sec-independent protein translocase protein TatB n=1 Tax=Acidithiobacillus sp. TaxID=1872118 RepID=UPI0025BA43C2|nr:Sec-independent protein translocase protein TatB [Acidithiobacillus sp.]MCK9188311.1 Sec-independent protein translocase protein TatB [Acidithiobacillus sp.]MCK9360165.1 Sec-independent protein translocase protein TatB [Acidithiobacillus sp.]